jgi:hypothetical protein
MARRMIIHRRGILLGGAAALAGWPSSARGGDDYEMRDILVEGDIASRFALLVPKHTTEKVPLLVAFHGLAETVDQKTGAWAWHDAYGLGSCYRRLVHAPVAPADARAKFWDDRRLEEVNASLAARPFGGLAVACPYTPDAFKAYDRDKLLDAYADWIERVLIPRAREELPLLDGPRHTGVDGVSLGGFVSMEVFLRKPALFGAWGSVQGAFGAYRVLDYADKLAWLQTVVGKRKLHVETSGSDTYRDENDALSGRLRGLGVPHDFVAPPGAHTQPFLRDSGTLEMLLWHDRALRS